MSQKQLAYRFRGAVMRPFLGRKRLVTRKRRGVRKAGTVVGRSLGFPNRMVFKHRYVENISMSQVGGALFKYQYSANGMYDPNITGGGHQPMNFDNLTALYNHYTVIGSKIKVTFSDANTTTGIVPTYAGIYLEDDTTSLTSYISIMEQKKGTSRMLPTDNRQRADSFYLKYSTRKSIGSGSVGILHDSNLSGTASANPLEQSYYTIWFQVADGSADQAYYCRVEIEYIAVWTELKQLEYQ